MAAAQVVDQEQLTAILREAARSVEGFRLWGPGRKIETALDALSGPDGDLAGLTEAQRAQYAAAERARREAARQEMSSPDARRSEQ